MESPDREVVLVLYPYQPKGRENVLATYHMVGRSAGSLPPRVFLFCDFYADKYYSDAWHVCMSPDPFSYPCGGNSRLC